MKKSLYPFIAAVIFGLGCTLAAASEVSSEATVLKITGSVKAQMPGQSGAVELKVGDRIPQGAVVMTGAGAEAFIQPFSGAVSAVKENSTVQIEKLSLTTEGGALTKQTATLNLKSGNLVSTIDPAKRAINNYSVRTPKGVAASRGTSYSVSVSADGFSIAATADSVTFTTATGAIYTIQAGMISITPPGGSPQPPVSLASAMATNPEVGGIVSTAVSTLATVVQNNLGGLSAESTTNLASQVLAVASAANPAQAASYTSQVVTAVTSSTSVTGASAGTTAAAGASVTNAAVTAAPQEAAQIAGAAATAAPQQSGVIAAAASQAAPGSSQDVVQSVATATGQSTASVQQGSNNAAAQVSQDVQQTNQNVTNVITPAPAPVAPPPPETPPPPPPTTPPVTIDTSVVSPSH